MKTYYFLFLLLFFTLSCSVPQEELADSQACCTLEATAGFASFAADEEFVKKHENPEEIHYVPTLGEQITFKAADGEDASAFYIKAAKSSKKYLFVIHEWWGLNDHIKQEAERFAESLGDVNVLALDLYDGKVATTRENAGKYMQSAKTARLQAIIRGAMTFAGKNARIASVGWCFGGGWSLQTALLAEKQSVGCIMYYGMPEKDADKLKQLSADVLGIFASKDGWINKSVVAEFEENMKKAGKNLDVKMYDAEHAFANPSNPKYQKEYAEEAYALSIAFLKERY